MTSCHHPCSKGYKYIAPLLTEVKTTESRKRGTLVHLSSRASDNYLIMPSPHSWISPWALSLSLSLLWLQTDLEPVSSGSFCISVPDVCLRCAYIQCTAATGETWWPDSPQFVWASGVSCRRSCWNFPFLPLVSGLSRDGGVWRAGPVWWGEVRQQPGSQTAPPGPAGPPGERCYWDKEEEELQWWEHPSGPPVYQQLRPEGKTEVRTSALWSRGVSLYSKRGLCGVLAQHKVTRSNELTNHAHQSSRNRCHSAGQKLKSFFGYEWQAGSTRMQMKKGGQKARRREAEKKRSKEQHTYVMRLFAYADAQ